MSKLTTSSTSTSSSINRWQRDIRRRQAREFYERTADERELWKSRNWYYYQELEKFCRFMVPPGSRVLEVGCGTGSLLAALEPSVGVGIDWSEKSLSRAREKHPHLAFLLGDAESLQLNERFDYIILSNLLGIIVDVQEALEQLQPLCHEQTRIIILDYNYLWEPFLELAKKIGWGMKHPAQNWLPVSVLHELLELAGFDVVRTSSVLLMPVYLPLLSPFMNRWIAKLPLIQRLCLVKTVIARPRFKPPQGRPASCSVVIPCRNERGTIPSIVERMPSLGSSTELIFVDGHSTDGTADEIKRVIRENPHKNIQLLEQKGIGKGDAVRQGFAHAQGDILIILDADMTVAPEEMPKFYRALTNGQGEFINGTRLIYPLDGEAMRFLNLMANKMFSSLFTYLLEQEFHDTLCGTKALWRRDYERIAKNRSYFGDFDPFGDFDLLFGAARLNLQIKEIPVRYCERVYGETNIRRFAHGWLLLKMCRIAALRLKFAR